jgi:hypothetical protein
MAIAASYRQEILKELADIPDEFIPFILAQIKSYKETFRKKGKSKESPTKRLLKLSGTLENPLGLSAKQYKRKVVEDYISQHL